MGEFQQARQAALIPSTEFPVQKQPQTLLEGEILDLGKTKLFVERFGHGVEVELTQCAQRGLL